MVDVKKFLQDIDLSGAGIRGPKGPVAHPIIGKSVNPIQTGEGRLSPPITTGAPKVFHLLAALESMLIFYHFL